MGSGPAERRRLQVVGGMGKYIETKHAAFPDALYKQYRNNLILAAGLTPTELGEMQTKGMGGKGIADLAQNTFFRTGLSPRKKMVEGVMNDWLQMLGAGDDIRFELTMPAVGLDPATQQANTVNQFINGLITLNEARSGVNQDPMAGYGDELVVIRNGQIINLTAALGGAPDKDADSEQAALAAIANQPDASPSDVAQAQRMIADGSFSPTRSSSGSTGTSTSSSPETPNSSSSPESPDTSTAKAITPYPIDINVHVLPASDIPTDRETANKVAPRTISKMTGVSDDDDQYWHAPLAAPDTIPWPKGGHANEVNIVAIVPTNPAYPPQPGVWKPQDGESEGVAARLGPGQAQCVREETAYLIDRHLGFYLVPVAWLTTIDGQVGSVAMFSEHCKDAKDAEEYSPYWVERAAVLEYVNGSIDRHVGNWLGHPQDDRRPVIIDNGLTLAVIPKPLFSPFIEAFANRELSPDIMDRIKRVRHDEILWSTIARMTDQRAVDLAFDRMDTLLRDGKLTIVDRAEAEVTGTETLSDKPTPADDVLPEMTDS
jgi:hypothetical protein